MAIPKVKRKTRYVELNVKSGSFVSKFVGEKYDFSDVSLLRKVLSNQKSKILHILKTKQPKSIYELAKILKRDFKSVREDVKFLEKFGFIEFHSVKTGNRESLMPVLVTEELQIIIKI
jgi:predicted transcriptional regulator